VIHILKTWRRYFSAVADGSKTFEVRRNDRGFKVGDTLRLMEVNEELEHVHDLYFTGRSVSVVVTYILTDDSGVIAPGFVVMGIRPEPQNPLRNYTDRMLQTLTPQERAILDARFRETREPKP
jgi:hypothetical protein